HIITDGWSMGVLLAELSVCYAALEAGEPPALPDLPIQYADYAAWQREQLDDARLAAGIEFWRAQLDGASQLLELPTDRPRRANRSLRGGKLELVLEDSTARALRELSQETSSTLYMVLFAAFATLLSRYSGQLDVVIGAPAANRDRVELEPLIGLFVNELPIRLSLAGRPSFRALVERVRTRMLAAQANSDIPFFKIVEALRPRRDASHAPLFQVIFVVHNAPSVSSPNAPVAGKEVPALRWSTMPHEVDATKLDLALSVGEADDGLTIALEYSSELFDAGRVQRMLDHYVGLLRAAVDQPDRCLAEVPLRGRSRATSAGDVERSARGEGAWHSFLDAFAHQVRAHPKATAVRDDDQTISYAELDAQSDRLAHLLRSRGVTRDSMVGLCRGPNCTSIACLLAIWKAGATYVPLGPDLPRERLVLILEETKTRLILADGETSARLADLGVEVLVPEHYADTIAQRPRLAAAPLRPEQVAYVIYTSGSTGRPKGVVVGHRGLAAVLRAIAARLTIGPGCRVLQFAAYSFDVSLAEIGATLASGASLVILPKGQAKVGPELERVIVEREVSHLIVSPSVLASLRVEAVPPTLTVIVGGEACSVAHVVKWAPGRRFLNCYGPTETTIGCVGGLCAPTDNPVTMGREFGPTSCVVLDDAMRPAPPGVIGELYIGGPALAHGYLARPRLTAERFVPDPFGEEPGARLYRSGDLAERLEDGRLVFRGRVDRQVKLRGYRIELGEIENALCDDPAVRGAAVIVREDHPGVRQLVAYVVTDADGWDELRISLQRALTGKLPGYMVPSAYIRLSELPLTSTDKLDLSALPAPVVEHHDDEGELSELAALIRQTWVEVLGRTELGIHDNFFELGGDSILSIRIIARLNEAGISLSPRQLFQHQTVAALAAVATRSSERVITATQGPVVGVVPLTPIQRWFLCSDQPAPEHFNMSLHFALPEGITLVGLRAIIDALVTHHDALRSVFERGDLGWTQRILGPEHAARVEEVFLDGDPEHLQAGQAAAAERAHAGFDLTAGPLVHALLFRYRAQPARPPELLIVVHHLVFDAVSSAVVTRDLEALLAQHKGGSALTLPRKTSSFKRWAERLVEFGRGPELAAELCYWKALSGRRASLPRDLVDPAQRGHADVFVSLSSRATRALIDEFPRLLGARVEAALLWTLTRTISKWTRHEGLLVELESHGREDLFDDLDVSRTVGWFTTSYPLWLPFEPERSDADQLTSIQKQLASLPRGGIGYGLLRYVQDDAELREQLQGLPQPEIAFNYFGQLGLAQGERGVLAPGQGPTGNEHSARRRRVHLFELNSVIEGGRLHLRWGYDRGVHRRETVERLAADFIAELERLAASGLALGRRSPEVEIPLSHVQEAMCTVDPSSPLGRSFRRCVSLRFTGTIDAEALRLALTGVVNRHEILRTSFVEREGRWVQIVGPKRTLELSLESLEGPDAERRLSARLRDLERRTLELTSPPLRIELYQLAPERCVLALVLHEMITDLASIDRLTAEVAQLYARLVRDDTRPLPEPALQYGDFAVWERRRLSGDALARELNFWRCELDGSPRALDLPFDRPRPSTRELEARYSPMSDEQWFSTAVDTVAREAAASNFVIMLAGYALLLMERGGVRDVIVGIAVSGRTQPGLRELVGPLVNALPIRVRLEGDPSFVEFAAQVGERLARAQAHDIPIDLIASTQRARPSPGEPIFQCLFSFRRAAPAPSLDAELDVELQFHGETLRSDLALTIVEQSGLLRGGMTFATDVFDEPTVAGLLDGLRGLIAAAAAEPSSLCSRLLRRARPSPQPPTNHQAAQPRAESSGPWFMRPRPRAHPKLRLFCFPYAGGSPAVFRSWAGALGDDIELVGVHAPGRGTRLHETPLRSARALVHELAERFTPFTRSPYALFGHSMGATVAFELAHELRRRGHPLPRRLILAGRRAPLEPKAHPDVHMLPNSDFVLELERLGGTPPDVLSNPELLELVLPALRADFQLIESWRYTPRPRLPVAITAICGDSDPDVSLKHMCGWAEHGSGFELHGLAGGHFFLTTAEDELLALLRRTLAFT
ncbi:MAG: amino acid adenylation domain-containing protein, partial [Myxococcales bacterium]|nr:amino acid adenylation domain-containing protein [Myxococcales bacterium]